MKSEVRILAAFILNLTFSVFEIIGGILTGSFAIISDAIHDMGDAAGVATAFILEKKSKRKPDKNYSYGYTGYSVIGGLIMTLMLLIGSAAVIYNAVLRSFVPRTIDYEGMLLFGIIGVAVNLCAAILTHGGKSLNQKAVSLHMLEDVLGWAVILVGAVIMKFTDMQIIDILISVGVAVFIMINAVKNLLDVTDIMLHRVPRSIDTNEIQKSICELDGVIGIHHIHIWSIDGQQALATMHIVTSGNAQEVKDKIRNKLKTYGIEHATLELEAEGEPCKDECCHTEGSVSPHHHHHH